MKTIIKLYIFFTVRNHVPSNLTIYYFHKDFLFNPPIIYPKKSALKGDKLFFFIFFSYIGASFGNVRNIQ